MSEDMPSWRYLASASSRLSSFRGYLQRDAKTATPGVVTAPRAHSPAKTDEKQTWRAWAGQRIKIRRTASQEDGTSESVNLFPGWATRRYAPAESHNHMDGAFEVEVFISGFACSQRPPELASRSQRAFIRLAKGFAALPKLAADAAAPETIFPPLTPSTEELLAQKKLPPRPTEITEDYQVEALEHEFRRANADSSADSSTPSSSRSSSLNMDLDFTTSGTSTPSNNHYSTPFNYAAEALALDLRRLHANLERRLQPFWSSVLASRTIRVHLFASPHRSNASNQHARTNSDDKHALEHQPVASTDIVTGPDGSFQARLKMKWEDMCQHPGALHIAFGNSLEEHNLLLVAELLPPPTPTDLGYKAPSQVCPTARSTLSVSITHSPIRVISDIDDTIKLSNILSGARAVFHNVFVKDLKDNIIPGMGEWYTEMWKRGVRFHYVSNGPFELLPVLSEFFQLSQLPPGSMRLKSYAGRSLFNGLLSAPATRKRAGLLEVLNAFPESRFLLIGDTGEQDLELYADIARERPGQILAVLVRDVDTSFEPIDDPTGWKSIGAAGTRSEPLVPLPPPPPPPPLGSRRGSRASLSLHPGMLRPVSASYARSRSPSPLSKPPVSASMSEYVPEQPGRRKGKKGKVGGSEDYFSSAPLYTEPEAWNGGGLPSSDSNRTITATDNPWANNNELASESPLPRPEFPSSSRHRPSSSKSSSITSSVSSSSSSSFSFTTSKVPEVERKRAELQARVYRARTQMPGHVCLRVFRQPWECEAEVGEVLGEFGLATGGIFR